MSYLGIDMGTTGCKAMAVNGAGSILAEDYQSYPLLSDEPGWAELDSEVVLAACEKVIASVAGSVRQDPVCAIAVSSQGEAFTAVDRAGKCLTRGMVSSDSRSQKYVKEWSADFAPERLYAITGHTAHPMFTLFKLLWLKHERRDVWEEAKHFLCYEDLLACRLGVEPAMGFPLAGRTLLFDIRQEQWSDEILESLELERERLARPLPAGSVSGEIPSSICERLGLSPGCLMVTGGHDQMVSGLGGGATDEGVAMYTMGTVECLAPAFLEPVFAETLMKSNLCTYHHAAGDRYGTVAFSLTGGNGLQWFCREFFETREGGDIGKLVDALPDAPSSLLFLPYLTPSGTPYFDVETPGALVGMRLNTTKEEMLKAFLEGVAMEMGLNLDILQKGGIPIEELRAVGGGAASDQILQMKADILGFPVLALEVAQAGCLGGAMLACGAVEKSTAAEIAKNWVKVRKAFSPRPSFQKQYAEKRARYREWYEQVRDFSRKEGTVKGN